MDIQEQRLMEQVLSLKAALEKSNNKLVELEREKQHLREKHAHACLLLERVLDELSAKERGYQNNLRQRQSEWKAKEEFLQNKINFLENQHFHPEQSEQTRLSPPKKPKARLREDPNKKQQLSVSSPVRSSGRSKILSLPSFNRKRTSVTHDQNSLQSLKVQHSGIIAVESDDSVTSGSVYLDAKTQNPSTDEFSTKFSDKRKAISVWKESREKRHNVLRSVYHKYYDIDEGTAASTTATTTVETSLSTGPVNRYNTTDNLHLSNLFEHLPSLYS